jgi:lipoate-protein ligase A
VIGRNQNAIRECNTALLEAEGGYLARRTTGGGAVYHDLGNLNYTFISHDDVGGIDFAKFTTPIISALATMGISSTLSGRNDIEVDGKKISGNAQCKKKGRVLHHGTLLFDSDLKFLSGVLSVDREKIQAKAIKSTRARVTNIKELLSVPFDINEFIRLISEYVIKEFSAEPLKLEINEQIKYLAKRNSSSEWLFPPREYLSSYNIRKKKRYPFGTLEVYLDMSNDRIKGVRICGDFFGNSDVSLIEGRLLGKALSNIKEAISDIDISEYIFGMTNDDFISHILN